MSYDCEHTPKCVNQRHHVSRFYTERDEGGPCKSCAPGSVSIEWNCPQCGGTGIDPDEKVLRDGGTP